MDAREHVSARAAELRRHAEEAERPRHARDRLARLSSERGTWTGLAGSCAGGQQQEPGIPATSCFKKKPPARPENLRSFILRSLKEGQFHRRGPFGNEGRGALPCI